MHQSPPSSGLTKVQPSNKPWVPARVKFIDLVRGWGFLSSELGGPDFFLHIETLKSVGYCYNLERGKEVEVQLERTSRGLKVSNIREVGACPKTVRGAVEMGAQFSTPGNGSTRPQGGEYVKAVRGNGLPGK